MSNENMFETKEVEAGGMFFHAREISVKQRRDIFAQHKEDADPIMMSVNLVLAGCLEFADKTADDVLALPGSVFDVISNAVADVSGMGSDKKEGEEKKPEAE